MENELDNVEKDVEEKLKTKNRFEKLSETAILQTKRADEETARATAESERAVRAEKERDFFKSFSQISSKHPEAANYQDQILERVNKGYDPEEAALAVLAKEGKLSSQPQQAKAQIAGGSASTTMEGTKSYRDMNANEKLDALKDLEKSGEITNLLRGGR